MKFIAKWRTNKPGPSVKIERLFQVCATNFWIGQVVWWCWRRQFCSVPAKPQYTNRIALCIYGWNERSLVEEWSCFIFNSIFESPWLGKDLPAFSHSTEENTPVSDLIATNCRTSSSPPHHLQDEIEDEANVDLTNDDKNDDKEKDSIMSIRHLSNNNHTGISPPAVLLDRTGSQRTSVTVSNLKLKIGTLISTNTTTKTSSHPTIMRHHHHPLSDIDENSQLSGIYSFLPEELEFRESQACPGKLGIWSKCAVPANSLFGPLVGNILPSPAVTMEEDGTGKAWTVRNATRSSLYLCAPKNYRS